MDYQLITDNKALEKLCQSVRNSTWLMLDTEFVRIRTFYPKLGLIQLFDGEQLALIDPLTIDDMTPFVKLLNDKTITKVLHACGEDIEVFQHAFGCIPYPMVDTQIMAAFLGHGLSTGFASLVQQYLGVELDKSEARTDWCARPLTQKQMQYAAADVFYLLPLFEQLKPQLEQANWWQDALQESQHQAQKRLSNTDIALLYREIKGAWKLTPLQLARLQPLAEWRYREAVKRDLALNFIFKEIDLLEVARLGLTQKHAMLEAGMDERSVMRHGKAIAKLVSDANQLPTDSHPEKVIRLVDENQYKQTFKTLKDVVQKVAKETGLATEFLASKKQIHQLIKWVWHHNKAPHCLPDVMQGWRQPLLGEEMLVKLVGN